METLTAPTLKIEGTKYIVEWDEGVKVECSELYRHSNKHIEADIAIYDYAELNGGLLIDGQRPFITKTWRSVISDLEDVSMREDWRQRLQQVSRLVKKSFLAGDPAIALGSMPAPPPTKEIIEGVLWQGTPAIIYGAGGIGKSIFGLQLIQGLHSGISVAGQPMPQINAMWLDWETSKPLAYWRNAEILNARNMELGSWPDPDRPESSRTHMVFYKEMVGSLSDNVETLAEEIERFNIGVLLIDSAIPACGGEAEATKPSQDFFTALRAIKPRDRDLSALIIAHVTKESASTKKPNATPFGSTVWKDRARDTFELIASQQKESNYTDFALHHRKSNMGKIRREKGYRVTWADGITIEDIDIRKNNELRQTLTIAEQAKFHIQENGALSAEELSDLTGELKKSITEALSKSSDFTSVNGKWEPSETDF